MIDFEIIWRRVKACQGETFEQIRGGKFTYQLDGNVLIPDRTNQNLPRAHFEEAASLLPLENTAPVQHLRGPSYLYAILSDSRIRKSDW
jgi:hypothetical protein